VCSAIVVWRDERNAVKSNRLDYCVALAHGGSETGSGRDSARSTSVGHITYLVHDVRTLVCRSTRDMRNYWQEIVIALETTTVRYVQCDELLRSIAQRVGPGNAMRAVEGTALP
jgi:hypothetical protein